ncbi:hypothetical protein PSHT_06533 [Puccinia striiformis]|uniref:Uncharacterized protein n=1 Tax=Puccinia striiformis TaxID=27350 RepID=A0A2S4W5H3_9BASI|nr:hypothetical protein PSHT_06533 [Puccinia striiformis]
MKVMYQFSGGASLAVAGRYGNLIGGGRTRLADGRIYPIPDSLGSTLAGVIRGAGKPKVGALINSIGYYVVGLPVGIFLTFSQLQLGIRGLWLGMLMAVTWTAIASSYYVFTKIIPFTTNQLPERQGLIIQNSGLGKASQGPFEDLGDYGTINTW